MAEQKKMFVPYTQSKTAAERIAHVKANPDKYMSVSYTHLTLPTTPYV